jgi:hypothetical protein
MVERLRALTNEAQSTNAAVHLALAVRPLWLGSSAGNLSHVGNLCEVVVTVVERALVGLEGHEGNHDGPP